MMGNCLTNYEAIEIIQYTGTGTPTDHWKRTVFILLLNYDSVNDAETIGNSFRDKNIATSTFTQHTTYRDIKGLKGKTKLFLNVLTI